MRATPWVMICALSACASPVVTAPRGVDGIEELDEALADLTSQCTYTANVVVLTLEPGDVGWIAIGTGGALEVNGYPCGAATAGATRAIDVREGGSGDQTLILDYRGGTFALGRVGVPVSSVVLGGGTGDELKLIGTDAADRVMLGASGVSFGSDAFLDLAFSGVEIVTINLDAGNDTLSGAGDATTGAAFGAPLILYGGVGNDSIRGGAASDLYYGGDGDDSLLGGTAADGGDTFLGGLGRDTADYSARSGALSLSLDATANDGSLGESDNITADVEILRGGAGDDTITGGAGADTLFGGAGDDVIAGGGGADLLYGEAGTDRFDEGSSATGGDVFDGGVGIDTIDYATRSIGVTIALDGSSHSGAPGEDDRILATVENAVGGSGDDLIHGSPLANILDGGAGNDAVYGEAGSDTVRGGAGTNTLYGDAGDDRFDQGATALGHDTLVGGAGIDMADYSARTADLVIVMDGSTAGGESGEGDVVGSDVEVLIGGAGADALTGNATDNQLEGRSGIDTLVGLGGDDVLDGGTGADALDCGTGDADISLDPSTTSVVSCEL